MCSGLVLNTRVVRKLANTHPGLKVNRSVHLFMILTASVLCWLRLFRPKTEGQIKQCKQETSEKSQNGNQNSRYSWSFEQLYPGYVIQQDNNHTDPVKLCQQNVHGVCVSRIASAEVLEKDLQRSIYLVLAGKL